MASIQPSKRNGVPNGFIAVIGGQVDGKVIRRYFKKHEDAERFIRENERTGSQMDKLFANRAELEVCLDRLAPLGVSVLTAVDFYLQHGARKANPSYDDAVALFIKKKKRVGRRERYTTQIKKSLDSFGLFIDGKTKVGDITKEKIEEYVFELKEAVKGKTKLGILTNLSVFFNSCISDGLLGLNPVQKIERPTEVSPKPKILTVDEGKTLFGYCAANKEWERLTLFVLVGYCGIRMEEASKLDWSNVDFSRRMVLVPHEIAKKAAFRENEIPANAMKWLELVPQSYRTGRIGSKKWEDKNRRVIQKVSINYTRNCLRHSFASYGVKLPQWGAAIVSDYLGHAGGLATLHSNYRNVTSKEDAIAWFSLVP
jgi:integrase